MTVATYTAVPLEPPYTRDGADPAWYRHVEALEFGPLLGRTSGSTRWHRIRSGERRSAQHRMQIATTGWPRTTVTYWCGAGGGSIDEPESARYVLTADTVPADEPLCGTCEGRAIGAGYPPAALALTDTALRFDPASRYRIPPLCPAAGPRGMPPPRHAARTFPCPACREPVRIRAYGMDANIERHEPGDGLAAPCPFHRWDHLVVGRDGEPRCRCRGET